MLIDSRLLRTLALGRIDDASVWATSAELGDSAQNAPIAYLFTDLVEPLPSAEVPILRREKAVAESETELASAVASTAGSGSL